MKRLLLALFLLTAAATPSIVVAQGNGQTTNVPKPTFVAKYNEWHNHIVNNQLNQAAQNFEELKPMFIGNFAADKSALVNAATQAEKDQWMNKVNAKHNIYGEIMNMASNVTANHAAMKAKFDEFADLY